MTEIQRTRRLITEAHEHLTKLEEWLNQCESALMNGERPSTLEDVAHLKRDCAVQECRIDSLYLRLAIQKHGHDWKIISRTAKVTKMLR